MTRHSAGLLAYRVQAGELLVFLGHMGGPFWARKDDAAWSIPKGEYDPNVEEPEAVAAREFAEEIGVPAPAGAWLELGQVRQRGGKVVTAFAVEAPASLSYAASNLVELEWPRGSGRVLSFPEVDRAQWMPLEPARRRLVAAQAPLLDRLVTALGRDPQEPR